MCFPFFLFNCSVILIQVLYFQWCGKRPLLKESEVWQGEKTAFLGMTHTGFMQNMFLVVLVPDQGSTCSPFYENVILLLLLDLYFAKATVSLQLKGRLGNLVEVDLIYESQRTEKMVICFKGFLSQYSAAAIYQK